MKRTRNTEGEGEQGGRRERKEGRGRTGGGARGGERRGGGGTQGALRRGTGGTGLGAGGRTGREEG